MVIVNGDFMVKALGGPRAVAELAESTGLDIEGFIHGTTKSCPVGIVYKNYTNSSGLYPDIFCIWYRTRRGSSNDMPVLMNIFRNSGYRESKLRVKTWFHNQVIPMLIEELFS